MMRRLCAVWAWLTRPRVAEGIVYEVHLYVTTGGRVDLFGAKPLPGQNLTPIYHACFMRLLQEMGALGIALDVNVGGQRVPLVRPVVPAP